MSLRQTLVAHSGGAVQMRGASHATPPNDHGSGFGESPGTAPNVQFPVADRGSDKPKPHRRSKSEMPP